MAATERFADPNDACLEAGAGILQQAIVQNGGTPSERPIDWVRDIIRAVEGAREKPVAVATARGEDDR